LPPLTKILRTFLSQFAVKFCVVLRGRDVKTPASERPGWGTSVPKPLAIL